MAATETYDVVADVWAPGPLVLSPVAAAMGARRPQNVLWAGPLFAGRICLTAVLPRITLRPLGTEIRLIVRSLNRPGFFGGRIN